MLRVLSLTQQKLLGAPLGGLLLLAFPGAALAQASNPSGKPASAPARKTESAPATKTESAPSPQNRPEAKRKPEDLRAKLISQFRAGEFTAADRLLFELEPLGPEVLPELIEVATKTECAAARGAAVPGAPAADAMPQKRGMQLLNDLPAAALRATRELDRKSHSLRSAQAIGLAMLENCGKSPADMQLAVDLALPELSPTELDPETSQRLQATIAAMLRRRPELISGFTSQIPKYHALTHVPLLGALGDTGTNEASRALAGFLGKWPAFDVYLLQQIGRRIGPLPIALGEREVSVIVRFLASNEPPARREAALALGRVESVTSVGELIDLLDDDDRGVQENAHWSLQRICGIRMPRESKRWRNWYSAERKWWETRGSALLEELASTAPKSLPALTREISTHRLYRDEIAQQVAALLSPKTPVPTGKLILSTLSALRSFKAIPPLVDRFELADDPLQTDTLAALTAITGQARGARKAEWADWIP